MNEAGNGDAVRHTLRRLPSRRSALRKGLVGVLIAVLAAALMVTSNSTLASATPTTAFDPGDIMTDAVFYNASSMTAAQIQGFLNAKEPSCVAGYTCLRSFTENTTSRAADAYCLGAFTGTPAESAAQIIFAVSQACGVNPQVMLVLLQKEEGLVTSTSPTPAVYQKAAGFACPDSSVCDSLYYGFTNQVYSAAHQFKIYQKNPTHFNFRAGRYNSIRFSPTVACGSGSVFIDNQATAGLYDYTPYQPNAAALAPQNLYSTGDGCSSYGNRNFWRYFSDWFGNPQGGGTLARTDADPTIYLVTPDAKYPVPTAALFSSLSALGPYQIYSQAYLDQFPIGQNASNLLRDVTTGTIYLAANGQKNMFPTCDMIAAYGFGAACGSYVNITPAQTAAFSTGAPVYQFALSQTTGIIYSVAGGIKRAVHTYSQMITIAQGGSTAYTSFPQLTLDQIPSGPDYIDPDTVVKSASSPTLYLYNGGTTLIPISTGAVFTAFGLSNIVVFPDASIASMTIAPNPLTIAVTCGTAQTYIAGGGKLWPTPSAAGLPTTALDATTCAGLATSTTAVTGAVFLINSANGYIYYVNNGAKQFMANFAQLNAVNAGQPLTFIPAAQASIDSIPTQTSVEPVGTLVKSASRPTVYLVDGASTKVSLPSFELAAEFGIAGYSVIDDATFDSYNAAAAPLSVAVTCNGAQYIAGGGLLWPVPNAGGLPSTTLDPATCAALHVSPTSVTGAVFLRLPTGQIYALSGGRKQFVTTMAEVYSLNGATAPLVFIPSDATVTAALPSGPNLG